MNHRLQDRTYVSPLALQTEESEATLRLRVVGEKGMFAIPISKTDQRFFPFQHRGSEEGYEHGFVSQVCVHVRSGVEGHVRHSHQQD
jgi:hypothetical protein